MVMLILFSDPRKKGHIANGQGDSDQLLMVLLLKMNTVKLKMTTILVGI